MLEIIKKRKIYLSISGLAVLISIVALILWGLKPGLDFTGGSLLEVKFLKNQPTVSELRDNLAGLAVEGGIVIQPAGDENVILRFQQSDEAVHQQIIGQLKSKYNENIREERFEAIGPSIGKELRTKTVYAIIFAILAIVLYIAYSFRKISWPIKSWKYGVVTIVALVHDIVITMGVFAFLGHFGNVEVNLTFVAALMTILGYSVMDTIVIFDRIRENLSRLAKSEFDQTVNRSINETIVRSINTMITVLLALIMVFAFGGASIKYFALALIVGIICGGYSSIFIASPLLVIWEKWRHKRQAIVK